MFQSLSNSWQLIKASWAVLQADKELLWFPVISGIVMILMSLVMLVPTVIFTFTVMATGASEDSFNIVGTVGLFLYYLVSYTISIYFNTGLVGAAMIRLDGGDPTLKDGFQIANSRLGAIIGYAAISATIGMILRMLRERGFLGELVASVMSLAWNVATFLVVPILVAKNVSPWGAIQESTALLKKTWGEQIVGNFGVGGIFGIAYAVLILLSVLLGFLLPSSLLPVLAVLVVVVFLVLIVLQGALNGIFQATLYRYAESGVTPDNFDINLIQGAFKPSEKRKNR
jgi:hypothetical protein